MTGNLRANLALVVSAAALTLSGFGSYKQFWPDDRTDAVVTHVEWSNGSGRFGSGPQLILGVTFLNLGNRPTVVSKFSVSYGTDGKQGPAPSCEVSDGTWTTIPWDKEFDGTSSLKALPVSVAPQIAATKIYAFEPIGLFPSDSDQKPTLPFNVCLSYTTISFDGVIKKLRAPLGRIEISKDRVVDFYIDERAERPTPLNY